METFKTNYARIVIRPGHKLNLTGYRNNFNMCEVFNLPPGTVANGYRAKAFL
jgi:hypothetical protein